jgi:tetratricopeptide (TPR) repeat protein
MKPSAHHLRGDPAALERQAQAALSRRLIAEAHQLAERLRTQFPERISGWVFGAQAAQAAGDFPTMLQIAKDGVARAPERADMGFMLVDAERMTGAVSEARERLRTIEGTLPASIQPWSLLSAKYAELGQVDDALRAAERVRALPKGAQQGQSLVAGALTALGDMEKAEAALSALIAENPREVDAFYQRAVLRKAHAGEPAFDEALRRLNHEPEGSPAGVPLHFALAKMLEDIGELDDAFDHLEAGSRARRARLTYRIEDDEATVQTLIETFDAKWLETVRRAETEAGPIFVMGLPRSGTTLVERMLASHSQIDSLGEINDLAYAVVNSGGVVQSKVELIMKSAAADMGALGAHYLSASRGYGVEAPMLIDKTPANFLYVGLIAVALPGAKVIHLRRQPAASGYAMFKTLFRMGYPFSYDLEETARYIAAHRRLMDHWRALLPGQVFDVDYEALVDAPEAGARAVIDHVGRTWEDQVMDFHKNTAPTATASAAQVREPVYTRSRDAWRDLEHRLIPLLDTLDSLGVTQ